LCQGRPQLCCRRDGNTAEQMIYYIRLKDGERKVEIQKDGPIYRGSIDDKPFTADARLIDGPSAMSLIVDKKCYEAVITASGRKMVVSAGGDEFEMEISDELERRSAGGATASPQSGLEEIKAPMPGVVVALEVKHQDRVAPGSPVVIVEAMKMQNEISALAGGVVKRILVKPGDVVESQQTLVVLEEA
jgi:biotin carboxyl carrier protein